MPPNNDSEQSDSSEMYNFEGQWKPKEPETFKEIVLRQLELCRVEFSKQLTKGGVYNVQTPKGILPVNLPDQKEICINTVQTLNNLLFFYYDKEAQENIKLLENEIDNAYNKVFQVYLNSEKDPKFKSSAMKSGQIQVNSPAGEMASEHLNFRIYKLYQKIFKELILLFKRKYELSTRRKVDTYE